MQGLVIRDSFDNKDIVNELRQKLSFCSKVVEIESIADLEKAKAMLTGDEPCLYFPNAFIRYGNVAFQDIANFHESHKCFAVILHKATPTSEADIISLMPSKTFRPHKTDNSLFFKPHDSFYASNLRVEYVVPKEQPIVFLYTHNRSEYLKLTLNSLKYSTIKPFQIKLLLNEPTPDTKKVALDFANGNDHVEILEIFPNSVFSAINLAIQWFNPKKQIIMEDDFILPQTVKKYFPNWAYQFFDRLNSFDVVGWSWSSDNSPLYFSLERNVERPYTDWIYDYCRGYNFGGHCFALNTQFYLDVLRKRMSQPVINPYYAAFDGDFQAAANKVCVPSLKGYHIGFNQEMDGFGRRIANTQHPLQYTMHSLNTGEKRTLDLRDIL